MKNPIKLTLSIVVAMALGGCNNLLYSDAVAPVYSKTQATKGQASNVPVRVHSRGNHSVSIEKAPANSEATVVNQIQKNPYAKSGINPVTTRSSGLPERPAIDSGHLNQQQATGRITGLPTGRPQAGETLSDSARIARANDPRIREASEVLGGETSLTGQNKKAEQLERVAQQVSTANRPESVKAEAVKRAQAARKPTVATSQPQRVSGSAGTEKSAPDKPQTAAVSRAAAVASQTTSQAKTPPKPATSTSATKALLQEARSAVDAGNYEKAASALERAHRIQPSNAKILYDIAQIRYAQGKYRQAESFASKAANYSKSSVLSKKIWTILANSRRALGNTSGAAVATKKAANF